MTRVQFSSAQLRHALKAAARCDAILNKNDDSRTYSYSQNWFCGADLARLDNGAGDYVQIVFLINGQAWVKGFAHESAISPHAQDKFASWPGMYQGLPELWQSWREHPEFDVEEVSFSCWTDDGENWQTGSVVLPAGYEDGSDWLIKRLEIDADQFITWGRYYYGESFAALGEAGVRREFTT